MALSFCRIGLGALALGLSLAAANAAPTLLTTSEAWEAYKNGDGAAAVCWAISAPTAKEPAAAKRDPIYFLITTWAAKKAVNEPSIVIGYQFKEGSNATVQVGSDKFNFFTKADGAWLQSKEDEQRLVTAMRGAGEMTVKGTSKRGTLTTDTYSLKGISAALDKVAEGCK